MVVTEDVNPEEWIVEIGQHLHFEIWGWIELIHKITNDKL